MEWVELYTLLVILIKLMNNSLNCSIVIPCYNEAKNLPMLFKKCEEIYSTNQNVEIVIVNNGSTDDSSIVIDELLGIFIILIFYDFIFIFNDIITLILIFFIFRLFDIIKIFPANYIDKNLKNGYGVMMDDIVAGIYTIFTLMILNAFI